MYPVPNPYPKAISEDYGKTFINCVPCSGVVIAQVASHGTKPATYAEAQALRVATGTSRIPLGPADLATAFKRRYGWTVPAYKGTVTQLITDLRNGWWGAVYIHYNLLPTLNRLSSFLGEHCIAVGAYNHLGQRKPGYLMAIDPLARPNTGYTGGWIAEVALARALITSGGVPFANLIYPDQFHPAQGVPVVNFNLVDGPPGIAIVTQPNVEIQDLATGKLHPVAIGTTFQPAYPISMALPIGSAAGLDNKTAYLVQSPWDAAAVLKRNVNFTPSQAVVTVTGVDVHLSDGRTIPTK